MKSKIVEVCQPQPVNWGKFIIAQFDEQEASHISAVSNFPLLAEIGYWGDLRTWLWVFDLQTGEGAIFPVLNRGGCQYDLEKHQIWVCPLYEPFLEWLYRNYNGDVDDIPNYLEIDVPASLHGYRRPGIGELTSKPLDMESLRALAQAILNISIKFVLEKRYKKDVAVSLEVFWELIRQEVAVRCRQLVEERVIANYTLLEEQAYNTQRFGKIFILRLTANGFTADSEPSSVTG
jgi:hypothetical protein